MYKITETFKDYMGIERSEDFYFNLDEVELYKLQLEEVGGFREMLQIIVQKKDIPQMIKVFEKIIDSAYGVRSADGRNFYKGYLKPEILVDFKSTKAYSQIFTRFATNAEFAAEFIRNVIPEDLAAKVEEMQAKGELPTEKDIVDGKITNIQDLNKPVDK